MSRPRLNIDGKRVRACRGSDSLRGVFDSRQQEIACPECSGRWLAAACATCHGTPIIPRHRAVAP